MTNPNIKSLFTEELDEILFESVDFHSELKNEVRKKITANNNSRHFYMGFRKLRIYQLVTLVAIISVVFVSSIIFLEPDSHETQPNILNENNVSTFTNDNLSLDPAEKSEWELQTKDEAKKLFGNGLLLPTYLPADVKLESIHVLDGNKEKVNKLILTYSGGDKAYSVIVVRSTVQNKPLGFEEVDLNGVVGYLKKEESVDWLDAELHWYLNDIHYMVTGLITSEEAMKIAQSFN